MYPKLFIVTSIKQQIMKTCYILKAVQHNKRIRIIRLYRGIIIDTSFSLPYCIVHNVLYYMIHTNDTTPARPYRYHNRTPIELYAIDTLQLQSTTPASGLYQIGNIKCTQSIKYKSCDRIIIDLLCWVGGLVRIDCYIACISR